MIQYVTNQKEYIEAIKLAGKGDFIVFNESNNINIKRVIKLYNDFKK
jgi:hypothetical protein